MWRRRFEEDWERRKLYLIRSLFEELPPLSPVLEEDESLDSPRRATIPPRSYVPPTSTSRPYSPLPPLIIEREPNRHDEPEEYYRKLEKKMLKVYRKLFIEGKSDISIENSDEEVIEVESNITEEINDAENYMEGEDGFVIEQLNNTTTCIEMVETRNSDAAEQNSIRTEDDNDFNEEFNDSNTKNNNGKAGIDDSSNSNGNEESQNSNGHKENSTIEIHKQCRKRTILEKDDEASESKKSRSGSGSTTEILPESLEEESPIYSQSRNGSRAEESEIQETDFRDHRIVEVVADIHIRAGGEALQAVEAVALGAIEDVDDGVMLENNGVPDNVSSSSGCKRSWSSSEESISHEDAGTQTNYDYETVNRNILRDIFVGPPKVFRLCSCVNHICFC